MEIALRVHVVVRHISSNITGCTESALCDHDGSVPYFPICQGTLPWQPNNIAVMKANRYYVHSLHVRQMAARFPFATTCY